MEGGLDAAERALDRVDLQSVFIFPVDDKRRFLFAESEPPRDLIVDMQVELVKVVHEVEGRFALPIVPIQVEIFDVMRSAIERNKPFAHRADKSGKIRCKIEVGDEIEIPLLIEELENR